MAKEIEFSVTESAEGGYEAKALCHCICTQAESLEELKEAIRDAVCCHFDEKDIPGTILIRLGEDEVIPL
jgi:hypothetical protein